MPTHFTPAAPRFLKSLIRHNDRLWFDAHKSTYETELKAPFLALIDELNHALLSFAPEHIRPASKIMMRIYRDIRFSLDKRPYKHHLSAWWARQGMEKTGAGFYLQIGPDHVTLAGGAYMPAKEQLLLIRRMLLDRHADYRRIMAAPGLRRAMQPLEPLPMSRGPKGFPADHPASDLILQRQWGVSAHLPMETALTPAFAKTIINHFKLAAPLVHFLNEPLLTTTPKKPMF